jgi:hypothetical protein
LLYKKEELGALLDGRERLGHAHLIELEAEAHPGNAAGFALGARLGQGAQAQAKGQKETGDDCPLLTKKSCYFHIFISESCFQALMACRELFALAATQFYLFISYLIFQLGQGF